jgi:hypothetical protein
MRSRPTKCRSRPQSRADTRRSYVVGCDGESHNCIAAAFTTPHHVFFLSHVVSSLVREIERIQV